MRILLGGFLFGVVLPFVAIVVAFVALGRARRRASPEGSEVRVAVLEEQVRGLLARVWSLEQQTGVHVPPPGFPVPPPPAPMPAEPDLPPLRSPADSGATWPGPVPAAPASAEIAASPPLPSPGPRPAPRLDLEQRIGARWTTWIGVIAILFGIGFFLKWSFENDLLGPGARVVLGLVAGVGLLASGLVLQRRRDLGYLSAALAGLGLGVLYLALFGAHALYGLLGPGAAFSGMLAVTLLGALVSVVSNRQTTAVVSALGGLLTPVLLSVEHPDERNLLAYLVVLDLLVLAIARFRSWPSLGRLAWAGTALLAGAALAGEPDPQHPLSRLALLSALFVLFLAVPLVGPLARRGRHGEIDLLLVAANAAGYFWAVYMTLEVTRPAVEGAYALVLAVLYRFVSADYAARVPDDEPTVVIHEGVAWTFLTLAIALALSGRWVTVAWAAQGVVLLWSASRAETPVAAWGGSAALLLAAARALAVDRHLPGELPVWNLTYAAHLLVVAALGWGGLLAAAARPARLRRLTGAALRTVLWVVAALVLAALLWREPPGLWPATLLTIELVVLGGLAREMRSPAWLIASPIVAAVLLLRVLGADDGLARIAAESLWNAPLSSRIAACLAVALAGGAVARSVASAHAPVVGRGLSGAAGLVLLFVLSTNWTRYQGGGAGWTTQVGLSILWTLYAAVALGWGFLRSRPRVRYAALALLGLTVLKVFYVDLSAVRTAYRILSFLVLGIVLLGVSFLYQKTRPPAPSAPPAQS
jgi:uncharacterized membrane protein